MKLNRKLNGFLSSTSYDLNLDYNKEAAKEHEETLKLFFHNWVLHTSKKGCNGSEIVEEIIKYGEAVEMGVE